jgi:hypothetical protein
MPHWMRSISSQVASGTVSVAESETAARLKMAVAPIIPVIRIAWIALVTRRIFSSPRCMSECATV